MGSALAGPGLGLPAELRALRRDEVDGAAERAVAAALGFGAEALVVPGDLWDAESVPAASIHRILEAFASFAPRPVLVAPGNHDFAGPGGFYDPAVLSALGMRPWPDNVFVFRGPEWTARSLPGRDDVVFVGRAFLSSAAVAERPLLPAPPRPAAPYTVLLLHGSLDVYEGKDAPTGDKKTAPFSRRELLMAGFSWAALGHHHHMQVVTDDAGSPRAAYSGGPTGRGLDETGTRHFLRVTLREGQKAVIEPLPADERTVHDVVVDATDLDAKTLLERVDSLLFREGVGTADFLRVTLTGTQAYGARPAAVLQPLLSRVKHLTVRDRTEAPVTAETSTAQTAEGRFTADLLARREAAADDPSRRVVDLALALGRDALAGRPVRPPDPET